MMIMARFPTLEESRKMALAAGATEQIAGQDEIGLRLDRYLRESAFPLAADWHPGSADAALQVRGLTGIAWRPVSWYLSPWIAKLLWALMHPRKDHRVLTQNERDQFNQALQAAFNDGSYQTLAAIHADTSHRMHSMQGAVGTQRFFSWHRDYLLKAEALLRSKQPNVMVPYWKYSDDHARPDWVWQPPGVSRGTAGGGTGSLPTQAAVDNMVANDATYTTFTQDIEFNAHNQVHNWCNGTVSSPPTAPQDPIFWLLHANVDRMWDLWQINHNGQPTLAGADAVMDPWPETAPGLNDIIQLGYSYQ
jgi:hypothetical protein